MSFFRGLFCSLKFHPFKKIFIYLFGYVESSLQNVRLSSSLSCVDLSLWALGLCSCGKRAQYL